MGSIRKRGVMSKEAYPPFIAPGMGMERFLERRLLDVDGLSQYLSMPKGTIYTYVSTGRIPKECIRHIGRALRFEVAAVDRWVDEQQESSGALV